MTDKLADLGPNELKGVIEVMPEVAKTDRWPWASSDDERRRAFIFEELSTPDCTNPTALIATMGVIEDWLRTGARPGTGRLKVIPHGS